MVGKVAGVSNQPTVVKTAVATSEITGDNVSLALSENKSVPAYVAKCFSKSTLKDPYMVGQVIQTPAYALITVGDSANQGKNTFCVVNKSTVEIELTPVSNLTYSKLNQ